MLSQFVTLKHLADCFDRNTVNKSDCCCKRMPGKMKGEMLFNIADLSHYFQAPVHLLIAGPWKQSFSYQEKNYTLFWLVDHHNNMMNAVLKKGSMKNYHTTEKYLRVFLKKNYHKGDVLLKDLRYEFITAFEFFVRSHPVKKNDPCTNNGLAFNKRKSLPQFEHKTFQFPQNSMQLLQDRLDALNRNTKMKAV